MGHFDEDSLRQLADQLRADGIDIVRIGYSDLIGTERGRDVLVDRFDRTVGDGVAFCRSVYATSPMGDVVDIAGGHAGGLPHKLALPPVAPARQEHVEDGAGGIHLEFEVARLVLRRLEEQLEDVVVPGPPVVLRHIREQVAVLHLRQEVEVLAVPQQAGARGCPRRALPGHDEAVDDRSRFPGRVVSLPVDADGEIRPAAHQLGRRRRGPQASRGGDQPGDDEGQKGQESRPAQAGSERQLAHWRNPAQARCTGIHSRSTSRSPVGARPKRLQPCPEVRI